ncbi:MAG: helix-turn-helix transcriptional regulator [Oleispira antarctica]|uniref:Transcriptional regulator, LuxR family protein n=1 Tax=Oleispira antarctica RB-8 TaxID=698738 RepID=R4YQU5_OLEAN|nr:helix-turn-helix transcriptional regulator [Oleispira antarctica]MBQ0793362.1 helix-turn-helix transcriptional regulator [Oleispira antarctica]CCK74449.1 transcriptional regulator, LuxR family protein [Oleispira antarctica RB-8]|tara:strand:+ start:1571 stop:2248 length:678 start_codon:yes stop_codon:yes gene_type:complete
MDSIASTSRRIILFGQQNLQNSILIGFIHQRTNIDCQLISTAEWHPEWNTFEGQTLALIDADCARTERLQDLLEQIFDQNTDIQVAFFNTQSTSPVERLIAWPMVNGIFYKETSQQQLVKGIAGIFEGEFWLSRSLITQYLGRTRSKPRKVTQNANLLTRREKQILSLTATGATNTEIAGHLNVSMHTVKTHIYNLFKKIDVSNRIQAVNWAKDNLEDIVLESVV